MLKENGKSKKLKFVKCDRCKDRVILSESEIIKINGIKYITCPFCSLDILL